MKYKALLLFWNFVLFLNEHIYCGSRYKEAIWYIGRKIIKVKHKIEKL